MIDLYYMHRRDLRVPIVETVEAMAGLVQAGQGAASGPVRGDGRGAGARPAASIQSPRSRANGPSGAATWNATWFPPPPNSGVGFVPYSPLGRGFLTGTVDASTLGSNDFRRKIPRFAADAAGANQGVVAAVRAVAAELSVAGRAATPAQVALAWLLAQGRTAGTACGPHPRHAQDAPDRRKPGRPVPGPDRGATGGARGRPRTPSSAPARRTPTGCPRAVNSASVD